MGVTSSDMTIDSALNQTKASYQAGKLGPPERGSVTGQVQLHPTSCLWPPGMSHQAIHSWPPHILVLEVFQEAGPLTEASFC